MKRNLTLQRLLFVFLLLAGLHVNAQTNFTFKGSIENQNINGLTKAEVFICQNNTINLLRYITITKNITYETSSSGLEGDVFNPNRVPVGEPQTINIIYNGEEVITITFIVEEVKSVSAGSDLKVCSSEEKINLNTPKVDPAGGEWYFVPSESYNAEELDKLIDQKEGTLDVSSLPLPFGYELFQLEYFIDDCSFDFRKLEVFKSPEVFAGDDITICEDEYSSIDLNNFFFDSGDPTIDRTTINSSGWIWSLDGKNITGSNLDVSQLSPRTYNLRLSYSERNYDGSVCIGSDTRELVIYPTPDIPTIEIGERQICGAGNVEVKITNYVKGVTYYWYNLNKQESIATKVTENTFMVPVVEGSNTFEIYAEQQTGNDFCKSGFSKFSIFSNKIPLDPLISPEAGSICLGQTYFFVGPQNDNFGYNWYSDAERQNLLQAGGNSLEYEPKETGEYTVYLERVDPKTGCVSVGLGKGTLQVYPTPPKPKLEELKTNLVCLPEVQLVIDNYVDDPSIVYYLFNQTTGDDKDNLSKSFSVEIVEGENVIELYATQKTDDQFCDSDILEFTIIGLPAVKAPTLIIEPSVSSICEGESVVFTAELDGNYTFEWFDENGVLKTDEGSEGRKYTYTASKSGNYKISVKALTNYEGVICESKIVSTTIKVNPVPKAPEKVGDVINCGPGELTLKVEEIQGITYRWYLVNRDGSRGAFTKVTMPFYTDNFKEDAALMVTAVQNGCESKETLINVDINNIPTSASFQYETRCGSGVLEFDLGSPEGAASFNWYTSSEGGEASAKTAVGQAYQTPVLQPATYDYYVSSVSGDGCESARQLVRGYVLDKPSVPVLESSTNTCEIGGVVSASVQEVAGVDFRWYDNSDGSGDPIALGNKLETVLQKTTTFWVQSYNVYSIEGEPVECPQGELLAVRLEVTDVPDAPTVSPFSATVCGEGDVVFEVTQQDNIQINWYSDISLENLLAENTEQYSQSFTSSTNTEVFVTATNTTTGCVSNPTQVEVQVISIPPIPMAEDIILCEPSAVTISPKSEIQEPIFRFYLSESLDEVIFEGATWQTNIQQNTTVWITQINEGVCESEATKITIEIESEVPEPIISDEIFCGIANTKLQVSNASPNLIYRWFKSVDAPKEESFATGESLEIIELAETTTYWVEATSNTGCTSSRVPVTIDIVEIPETPMVLNKGLCGEGQAVLTVDNAQQGVIYQWFADENLSQLINTGVIYRTEVLVEAATYYIIAVKSNENFNTTCVSDVDKAEVQILIAGNISIGENLTMCADAPKYNLLLDVPFDNGTFSGTGVNGTEFIPSEAIIGTNEISYTYTSQEGCEFFGTRTIEVIVPLDENTDLLNTSTTQICLNNGLLNLTQFALVEGGIWQGDGVDEGIFNPLNTGVGSYELVYEFTSNFCTYSAKLKVEVIDDKLEEIILATNQQNYCIGDRYAISVNNPNEDLSYQWIDEDGNEIGNGITFEGIASKNQVILCEATNLSGCSKIASSVEIKVSVFPEEISVDKTNIDQHDFVQFTLTDTENTTYLWSFGTGETSVQQSPTYYFHEDGTFEVKVYMQNTLTKCEDSLAIVIQVGDTDIDIITDIEGLEIPENLRLSTFPQPFKETLQLTIDAVQNGEADIVIFDATGKLILENKENIVLGENLVDFETKYFSSGMYVIKVAIGKEFKVLKAIKR